MTSSAQHREFTAAQSSQGHQAGGNAMATSFPTATILGYPRIGSRRELKRALESYWAGRIDAEEFQAEARRLQLAAARHLIATGLTGAGAIPGDFSAYDQVLDAAVLLGAIPVRFEDLRDSSGQLDTAGYFALARGDEHRLPLEMTKWFDSNYHYLVPEVGPQTQFSLSSRHLLDDTRALLEQGIDSRPYLLGPVSFLLLSKAEQGAPQDFQPLNRLADLLPVYTEFLNALAGAGVSWVQLDEPALCADWAVPEAEILAATAEAYRVLSTLPAQQKRPRILVSTPYGSVGAALPILAGAQIEALHLDLVRGGIPEDLPALAAGLAGTTLVAGVVDGRNIWRNDLAASAAVLEELRDTGIDVAVCTATSTFHVPYDAAAEDRLDPVLRSWLAFADQKITEVLTLAQHLKNPASVVERIEASTALLVSRADARGVWQPAVRQQLAELSAADFERVDYGRRAASQAARLCLPELPTTTIGSFPQTPQIRSARARNARGELSGAEYRQLLREEIRRAVDLQEELGLDVLVHGEAERNDMVQYFGEQLAGFAITQQGWVQSYGSRCTRPSILWGMLSGRSR